MPTLSAMELMWRNNEKNISQEVFLLIKAIADFDWVANSDIGKGVTNTVNSIKTTVGNAFHEREKAVKNFFSDAVKNIFSSGPSLG